MSPLSSLLSAFAARPRAALAALLIAAMLAGCADGPPLTPASAHPGGNDLAQSAARAKALRQREQAVAALVQQADADRAADRLDDARRALVQAQALDASHPRVAVLAEDLARALRHRRWVAEAAQAEAEGRPDEARRGLERVLAEAPGHGGARRALLRLAETRAAEARPAGLAAAYQKPVTLEFREAPLRQVLEGLARSNGINFVFDREVRGETRLSVFLREVSLEQALQVILSTQQLERKLLNDNTLLIYPATAAKQREHQELVTRSFYLVNADVKQAQSLVRTMAKTRDIFVDERLNLLVVRDTVEVVRLIEQLLASIDLAEPEVVLEVEVLEIASSRLDEIGLQWPESLQYGLTGASDPVELGQRGSFRISIANPALLATLRGTSSNGNVLANPRLRARNHEKARVMIGEKLPVFTTTSTANVGVSASVSYLDVGLKLEVEPSVQLDNDVVIKVNLDVSTLIGSVPGPQGSVGYRVGTRQASTSLRLRDGETQVLAGLIRDEDSKTVAGLPGLAQAPLVGRLFGKHTDDHQKSEVVLLITPHVVRNLGLPDAAGSSLPSGVEANPGAAPLRLSRNARVTLPLATGVTNPAGAVAVPTAAADELPEADRIAMLVLATSGKVEAGAAVAVTLHNRSSAVLQGELVFDAALLAPAQPGGGAPGRVPFDLSAGAERVLLLRALPAATGQTLAVSIDALVGTIASGEVVATQVQGDGAITVVGP